MISVFAMCASMRLATAQTNVAFQDCHVGDLVKVRCDRPLLVLSTATLQEISSNTVTVCTPDDRFTLNQTNVVLVPLENPLRLVATAEPTAGAASLTTGPLLSTATNSQPMNHDAETLESIRAAIIDSHKLEAYKEPKMVNGKWVLQADPSSSDGQKKYDQANTYYQTTMNGVIKGSVTQEDLVRKAREVLAECDKYKKERADDPQYEQQIETLRDFVRRSEAGEKFNFGPPVQ